MATKPGLGRVPTYVWIGGAALLAYLWWRHTQAAIPAPAAKGGKRGKRSAQPAE